MRPGRLIAVGLAVAVALTVTSTGSGSSPAQAQARVVLRPTADVLRQWTGTTGPAWSAVDDDVRQPAPVEHDDFIYGSQPGRVTEMHLADHAIGAGTATPVLWFYANTGAGTRLRVEAVSLGAGIATTTVPSGQGYTWRSLPLPALEQARLNDLRIRFTALEGGDSNVRAAYAELSSVTAPPLPPPPPPPPVVTERPYDRFVASYWAPYILQRTAPTRHWDYLAPVDYDGDWDTRNNWENADRRELLKGTAYFSVVETPSHWFVLYAFYHPRDWESQGWNTYDKHENDMEGVLLTVKRDGTPVGSLQAAVTVAHHDFFSFTPEGSELSKLTESIDGRLMIEPLTRGGSTVGFPMPTVGPRRPLIDIDPKSHAVRVAHRDDWTPPLGRYVSGSRVEYWPGATGQVPNDVDIAKPDYELVSIFAPGGLWQHRNCPKTFASWGVFRGDNFNANAANAPWRWDDHSDQLPHGALATDPALLMRIYHRSATPFDLNYTYNPYTQPAPETC
ncbi:hypothetical protein JCM9957A_22210 [Kineosporia succinea]